MIFSLVLVCLLLLRFSPMSVYARNPNSSNTTSTQLSSYKVEFESGITINSPACLYNVQTANDNIQQISFTYNSGRDTFTLGCWIGADADFNWNLIQSMLEESVNTINEEIRKNQRLSGNSEIVFDLLTLHNMEIVQSSSTSSTTFQESLVGAKKISSPLLTPTSYTAPLNTRTLSATSSYHYTNALLKYWHNAVSNSNSLCTITPVSPHSGDGNSRYDAGYNWAPKIVTANFISEDFAGQNSTTIYYQYDQAGLDNLVMDNNEALEIQMVFYDYDSDTISLPNRGTTYQVAEPESYCAYSSSQPNYYFDTYIDGDFEEDNEICFCLGVPDASELEADRWYYWNIVSLAGNRNGGPQSGRFRVEAQRSYRFIEAWESTLSVYTEEHDRVLRLGIPFDKNFVVDSAWVYDDADIEWTFNAATDPISYYVP